MDMIAEAIEAIWTLPSKKYKGKGRKGRAGTEPRSLTVFLGPSSWPFIDFILYIQMLITCMRSALRAPWRDVLLC